jgi:hypothetical protein
LLRHHSGQVPGIRKYGIPGIEDAAVRDKPDQDEKY